MSVLVGFVLLLYTHIRKGTMTQRRMKKYKKLHLEAPKAFVVTTQFSTVPSVGCFWKLSTPGTRGAINRWSATCEGHAGCYKFSRRLVEWCFAFRAWKYSVHWHISIKPTKCNYICIGPASPWRLSLTVPAHSRHSAKRLPPKEDICCLL